MEDAKPQRPPTAKEIASGLIFALIFIGLGISMFIWPDAIGADTEGPSGRKGGLIFLILKYIWSLPAGIIAILLGLLFGAGSFMKKDVEAE